MRRHSHFRRHAPSDSWAGLVFVAALTLFDVWIVVYLVVQLWPKS